MPRTSTGSSRETVLFPLNPLFQEEGQSRKRTHPFTRPRSPQLNSWCLHDSCSPLAQKCSSQHSHHSERLLQPNCSILRMVAHSLLMLSLLYLVTFGLACTTILCLSMMPLMCFTAFTPARPIVNRALQLLLSLMLNLVVLTRLLLATLLVL